MNLKLIHSTQRNEVIINKTNKRCWWDHHTFDCYPFFLVDQYHDDIYYIFGCFCSISCALAYNVALDDYKVSERYALTVQLFRSVTDYKDNVSVAYNWLSLEDYGGPLTIEQFRQNCITSNKDFIVSFPPVKYIPLNVNEKTINDNSIKTDNNSSESEHLILRRSKPLPNSNQTLMETMGLKLEKKKKRKY